MHPSEASGSSGVPPWLDRWLALIFESTPRRAAAIIGGGLAASTGLTVALGGPSVVAPHWFYIPIAVAGVRFGPKGAAVAGVSAGLLAGPVIPAETYGDATQDLLDWGSRLAFFVVLGVLLAYLGRRTTVHAMRSLERDRRATELARALEQEEFRLVFQPVVELSGGTVVGVEALIRWEHPERGVVAPSEFIPPAELSGDIVAIDRWVIDRACEQLGRWNVELAPLRLGLAINVSGVHIGRPELEETVLSAAERHGVGLDQLVLEVTETALVEEMTLAAECLHRLRDLGVQVAVDDFGTGYASLRYLGRLPVDVVKVDRSFVAAMRADAASRSIVASVIELARSLGAITVGEGVEMAEDLDTLRSLGCDAAQGYFIASPADPDLIDALLANGTAAVVPVAQVDSEPQDRPTG
ncbi:MAG: EAL domain-containing protein [Acidimicrobiales bacterium]